MKAQLHTKSYRISLFRHFICLIAMVMGLNTGMINSVTAQDVNKQSSERYTSFRSILANEHNTGKVKVSAFRALSILNGQNFKAKAVSTPFNIERIEEYHYNSDDEQWEESYFEEYSQLTDGNGYTKTYYYKEEGEVDYDYREEYAFDENDNLASINGYDFDDFDDVWVQDDYRATVSYDNEGRVVMITEEELNFDDEWIVQWRATFEYRENGTIAYEEEERDSDNYVQSVVTVEDGNFVEEGYYYDYEEENNYLDDGYYRYTVYNQTLEQDWLTDYNFYWAEYDQEIKENEEDEYVLNYTTRFSDESTEDEKIVEYYSRSYIYETESYEMTQGYRDRLIYENGKISEVFEEYYSDEEGWGSNYWSKYFYGSGNSVSNENINESIKHFALQQNYPNPFNPTTNINYSLPEASEVRLQVFDMLGRNVATLVNERKAAGSYIVQFDAGNLSSGMYIYRIKAGNFTQTRKLTLMK